MFYLSKLTKNNLYIIFFIIIINFLAHLIPFERSSVAPDDFSFMLQSHGLKYFIYEPHRPLQYIWFEIQSLIIGDNGNYGLILIFISTSLLSVAVYLLIFSLLEKKISSLFILVIYVLLINKLEIYHAPAYTFSNLASIFYILSLLFFISFIKYNNLTYYLLSFFTYLIGIFTYEVGFFMPFMMLIYIILFYKQKANLKVLTNLFTPFIFIIIFYSYYRISGAFGFTDSFAGRNINIYNIPSGIIDIFHTFFGRYMIRNLIYGIYNFFDIDLIWILILLSLNLLFLLLFYKILENNNKELIKNKILYFFLFLFLLSLIPNILVGAVAGRNTLISSISISLFIYYILNLFTYNWKKLFIIYVFFTLIISQGNGWAQIVASRISGSVYEKLQESKNEIQTSDVIIIDIKSFANKINYTFIEQDFNTMNTYYGAQLFEDWGLQSMVYYIKGGDINKNLKIYISTESPTINNSDKVEFFVSDSDGYRKKNKRKITIENKNILLVNFDNVYENGYYKGKRL